MKRKLVDCLLIICLFVFFTSGMASAKFLNDWKLDIDGTGDDYAPVEINELLDIVGYAYIVNTLNGGTSGTFDDYGVFVSIEHDTGILFPWAGDYELTAKLYLSGNIILVPDGMLTFTGGTLDIYADKIGSGLRFSDDTSPSDGVIYGANDGTKIASFDLVSGSGTVDPTGVPNGEMTITFKATDLAPNVWFDKNGTDLSTVDPLSLVFGYSTTNASYVENPTDAVIQEIAGEFAGVSNPANDPPGDLFVSPNGQFRLEMEEVPPGECRVTAGGVEISEDEMTTLACSLKPNGKPDPKTCAVENANGSSFRDTWGGQAGASGIDGNWTHHHQVSPHESFTFHSNTVTWIECSDPGIPCTPAGANAETRQIDFRGIGRFTNQKGYDHFPTGNVGFTVHLEDIGEPGPGGKWPSSTEPCPHVPGDPIDNTTDCENCTDYYEIRIYDNADPDFWEGTPIYVNGYSIMGSDLEGYFITSGNVQMHPGK